MAPAAGVGEGLPEPLGVTLAGDGVNVAVWSENARAVEICLFDADDREFARIALPARTGPVFHGRINGVAAGQKYGLRAHGPWAPEVGHRFNPAKLLTDPYALRLDRGFALHPAQFALTADDEADSAPFTPKAIIGAPPPPVSRPPLNIPWGESVIYELHVRGFTKTLAGVPEALRGTFAGLGHPAAVAHLKRLGVTAVEILPACAWIDERHLPPLGLTNYWGYNPVAFMVPDPRLAPGGWAEVRAATDALAAAGIETLLDVVFNHTGEGDALGPTLSLRGLDNARYYRLGARAPRDYLNDAGTGNTLALNNEPGLRLAMDAMRAWRLHGGVDGFRFDLATVLGRTGDGFDPAAPLFAAIDQDPTLRDLKRIAEPWDCGLDGYQIGRFPPAWGEWNDRFRDTARGFWRGDGVTRGALATRLAGSADAFAGRRPSRSVNFVVAHDGFTLADLVAYAGKHNEANGEENRDGADHNLSWNHGVEGPSDDPGIRAARLADQRALLATLLLSRGTPMLAMGAELGHGQSGNNNAYAQDGPLGWIDWATADQGLIDFTARLIALRREHPALRADRFLTGGPTGSWPYPDVAWRTADGSPLAPEAWDDPRAETLVMALAEPMDGGLDRVVLAIHRGGAATAVTAPEPRDGYAWALVLDSADPARGGRLGEEPVAMAPRSVLLLAETAAADRRPRGVDDATLARLADAAGIAPHWSSIDGAAHRVTADTRRALLKAMGLTAETTNAARESLRRLAETHDRRGLPFVVTTRGGRTAAVAVVRRDGAAPVRTWLSIEGASGVSRRLRVTDAAAPRLIAGRDGRLAEVTAVDLPPLPAGDYVLRREDQPDAPCRLIVAPDGCHVPPALARGDRLWGVSAQVYALRRGGDQGIGDFTTLGELGERAAAEGAAIVGLNPMHALFPHDRERASPYYPSDRRFLDPIYLDLARVPFAEGFDAETARLGPLASIDHAGVWALKASVLEASYARGRDDPAFARFVAEADAALMRFALFQAIAETQGGAPWTRWPEGLRNGAGAAMAAFGAENADRVRRHLYLQWLCERQLAEAAERASGLAIGLCRDLAVGAAPDGAEQWAQADKVAAGVSIGAPPDPFGPQGQVWGLPPYNPHRLTEGAYASMSELFAANMRHAGALRIDHVMGLHRQFWVPDGAAGSEGAYVAYPFDDLLNVLALESDRARCLVIGEDLGTVPEGLRERLAEAAVLSYRVLPFERDGQAFNPPKAWPREAWACAATHDLPPLAGWWTGVDIEEQEALGLIGAEAAAEARAGRLADKADLIDALAAEHLIADERAPAAPMDAPLAAAIHGYIARTGAALAVVQVEDLAGETTAINLPGTDRERPNWRRRVAEPVETLFETPPARDILAAVKTERERPET